MTGERWERIKEVFSAALERDPSARVAFLDEACAGDAEMRREVDSLARGPPRVRQLSANSCFRHRSDAAPSARRLCRRGDGRHLPHPALARPRRDGDGVPGAGPQAQPAVALKVLHPELAHALGADRFLREIEVAANLSHPHILPLFDSGQADGLLYYVMPYVEGESLRDRLQREVQLPLDEALRIAQEVADALAFAHGHGIIHRDIKPENVMLSGGHALVADFGIARALGQVNGTRLTETGMAVGTAAYMCPEQASAASQIDGRTDIYSLGCVVYEMLAGEPPYTGPTAQAIIAKRFTDPVPSVRRMRAAVA